MYVCMYVCSVKYRKYIRNASCNITLNHLVAWLPYLPSTIYKLYFLLQNMPSLCSSINYLWELLGCFLRVVIIIRIFFLFCFFFCILFQIFFICNNFGIRSKNFKHMFYFLCIKRETIIHLFSLFFFCFSLKVFVLALVVILNIKIVSSSFPYFLYKPLTTFSLYNIAMSSFSMP